jgi:uncharacterized protein YecE (DUF72 family)
MQPSFKYSSENLYTVSSFFSDTKLKNNAVIEFRDPSWWKVIDEIEKIGIVFCSVDAPDLPRTRIVTNNTILSIMVTNSGTNIFTLRLNLIQY